MPAEVVVKRDRVERGVNPAAGQERGQRGGKAQRVTVLGEVERLGRPGDPGASSRVPSVRSASAKANMPLKWRTQPRPHRA